MFYLGVETVIIFFREVTFGLAFVALVFGIFRSVFTKNRWEYSKRPTTILAAARNQTRNEKRIRQSLLHQTDGIIIYLTLSEIIDF